jgi:hypothetical protein
MRIEDPVDLGMLPGETVGLAVSRFAGTILVSVKGLDSGGLYLLGRIGSPRLLLPLNDPTTPVLTNSERDLVIADRSTSEIHVLQRFAYRLNDTIIAVEPAESASWMGVTVSPDGRRIFLIDRADRSVTILDRLSGLPSSTIRLSFEPASMERASQQGLYLLRPVEDSVPLHLLVSNGEPAIYFIPNDNSSYTKD